MNNNFKNTVRKYLHFFFLFVIIKNIVINIERGEYK